MTLIIIDGVIHKPVKAEDITRDYEEHNTATLYFDLLRDNTDMFKLASSQISQAAQLEKSI